TVTLTNEVDADVSVNVSTVNGTAKTSDGDYTAVVNHTVTFLAGETSKTFTVTPTADTKVELDEDFTFSQSGVANAGRSVTTGTNGTGTILNDDTAQFNVGSNSGNEDDG